MPTAWTKRWESWRAVRLGTRLRYLLRVGRRRDAFDMKLRQEILALTLAWPRRWLIFRLADGKTAFLGSCTDRDAMRWSSILRKKLWSSAGLRNTRASFRSWIADGGITDGLR